MYTYQMIMYYLPSKRCFKKSNKAFCIMSVTCRQKKLWELIQLSQVFTGREDRKWLYSAAKREVEKVSEVAVFAFINLDFVAVTCVCGGRGLCRNLGASQYSSERSTKATVLFSYYVPHVCGFVIPMYVLILEDCQYPKMLGSIVLSMPYYCIE